MIVIQSFKSASSFVCMVDVASTSWCAWTNLCQSRVVLLRWHMSTVRLSVGFFFCFFVFCFRTVTVLLKCGHWSRSIVTVKLKCVYWPCSTITAKLNYDCWPYSTIAVKWECGHWPQYCYYHIEVWPLALHYHYCDVKMWPLASVLLPSHWSVTTGLALPLLWR